MKNLDLHAPGTLPRFESGRVPRRASVGFVSTLLCILCLGAAQAATAREDGLEARSDVPMAAEFQREVKPRLQIPDADTVAYAARLQDALDTAKVTLTVSQFVVLVDRNPNVQAALVFWGSATDGWRLVGATPVSTGLPGR